MACGVILLSSAMSPLRKALQEDLQQMPAVLAFWRGFDTCQKVGMAAVSATRCRVR